MEAKDRKYHSNPSMSKEFGQFSPPIPTSMIEQMNAMKIKEELEATRAHQQSGHGSYNNMKQNQKYGDNITQQSRRSNEGQKSENLLLHNDNNGQNAMLTPTKRQRMATGPNSNQMDMIMEDTQMAGLAKQASQQQ
jgi:hypothetical protein